METREYELEYDDETHDRYFANVIAEYLYSQIEYEERHYLVVDKISNHQRYGTALEVANRYTVGHNGNRIMKKTTHVW